MSVEVALSVLKASSGVTDIVGTGADARISPLIKEQTITIPAVTIQRTGVNPANHLRGNGSLDESLTQIDSWSATYSGARTLASACRSAMEAAGHLMVGEYDNYDSGVDPGLYRVTQDYRIWV